MKLYRSILVLLLGLVPALLLLGLAALSPVPAIVAQAAPTATPAPNAVTNVCNELQVILVADQSGSMAGYTDVTGTYYPPTDPVNMRFAAMRMVVETLLYAHPAYTDVSFKTAIIDFGDTPQVRLGWTDLNAVNEADATSQLGRLAGTFNPTPPLGSTMPGDGLEQAASLFGQQASQVDGCPRRVVILVTDGLPYDDVENFNWQSHLNEAAAYANQYLPFPNHRVYVIGLDQDGVFFDESLDEWARVTGDATRVRLARSTGEMGVHIANILYDALQNTGDVNITRGCADNGLIQVPPYKQRLRIMLFKTSDLGLHLEVEDPSGRRMDNSQTDVTITGQDTAIETLVASNPQPGTWRVLTQLPAGTEDQCLVNFIAIPAVAQVVEPAAGARVPRFSTLPITFQLVDEAGDPLPDYGEDQYDLQMNIALQYGGGQTRPLTLSANPGQQYRGEATAYYEGPAEVLVHATAFDGQNDFDPIYDGVIASFDVLPIRLEPQKLPAAGQRIGQHTPLPISFAVVDDGGRLVELDMPLDLQLSLTADGQPQTVPSLISSGGLYSGTLPLEATGAHTLAYTATVAIPAEAGVAGEVVTLGAGAVGFDVFPVNRIQAEFAELGGVATDPLLRASGLPLTVRLVDDANQAVSPAMAGAADPTQVFDVTITDADGVVRVQGPDQLVTTGEPGVFRLKDNDLGRGDYAVVVRPASTVSENYTWGATEWSATAVGKFNPWFLAVVAGGLAVVGAVGWAANGQARLRRHPLSGTIQVYEKRWEEVPGGDGQMEVNERSLMRAALPINKNRVVLRPSRSSEISHIVVTSPDPQAAQARMAHVAVYRKNVRKPTEFDIAPSGEFQIPGTQIFIGKDRRPGAEAGSQTAILSDTF